MSASTRLRRTRVGRALSHWHNWVQLAKFCAVGASGYVVNLAVYTLLLKCAGLHYLGAAVGLVPRRRLEQLLVEPALDVPERPRALRLPGDALLRRLPARARREPGLLRLLVGSGVGKILAQAIAIVLVTPLNFVGNKLWSLHSGNADPDAPGRSFPSPPPLPRARGARRGRADGSCLRQAAAGSSRRRSRRRSSRPGARRRR